MDLITGGGLLPAQAHGEGEEDALHRRHDGCLCGAYFGDIVRQEGGGGVLREVHGELLRDRLGVENDEGRACVYQFGGRNGRVLTVGQLLLWLTSLLFSCCYGPMDALTPKVKPPGPWTSCCCRTLGQSAVSLEEWRTP